MSKPLRTIRKIRILLRKVIVNENYVLSIIRSDHKTIYLISVNDFELTEGEGDTSTQFPVKPKTGKRLTTTTTTTTTTTRKPTTTKPPPTPPHISNGNLSNLPPALKPNKEVTPWCLTAFILEGVELADGLKSGPYRELGKANDMKACMQKCCDISDCTAAYLQNTECYGVRCLDKKSCEVKIAVPGNSVGYVVRNGWSLFSNQSEAMKSITNNQNTVINLEINNEESKSINKSYDLLGEPITFPIKDLSPIKAPVKPITNLQPLINPPCEKKDILYDHRFTAGMKAGIFRDHGEVSDFDSCIMYCCKDRSCNAAYMVDKTCYSVKCFSEKSCETFGVPKFFLNPIISFVDRRNQITKVISEPDPEYGLKHHNYTVTLTESRKPKDKYVHYSDHESESLSDKMLQSKMRDKDNHGKYHEWKHFKKGSKRHKQKGHSANGDKKILVPSGSLLKNLVHQIIGEDLSGSGTSEPVDDINLGIQEHKLLHHRHKYKRKRKRLKHRHHHHHNKRHRHNRHHRHKINHNFKPTAIKTATVLTTSSATKPTTTPKPIDRHYPLPLSDADIDTIRALSPERGKQFSFS